MMLNKRGQIHGHYHGNIPVMIWVLIISIACIIIGSLIPQLGDVLLIGVVLFVIWLGVVIIRIFNP